MFLNRHVFALAVACGMAVIAASAFAQGATPEVEREQLEQMQTLHRSMRVKVEQRRSTHVEVSRLVGKALRDPKSLTPEEIRSLAASALAQTDRE